MRSRRTLIAEGQEYSLLPAEGTMGVTGGAIGELTVSGVQEPTWLS